jgi:hypothetical protein
LPSSTHPAETMPAHVTHKIGAHACDRRVPRLNAAPAVTRRQLLQVGYSTALGIGLDAFLAKRAHAAPRAALTRGPSSRKTAKSVLLVFLTGAPSHIDTFDMKPEAPAEIRGEFDPIETSVPGIFLCEHLPRLASRMQRIATVRTMTTNSQLSSHETGTHALLTGIDQLPVGSGLYASRQDWPCYAAGIDFARGGSRGVPNGVHVPDFLAVTGSAYCGQNAGFLGAAYDPWQERHNLQRTDTVADQSLSLSADLPLPRIEDRRRLLAGLTRQREASVRESLVFESHQERAFDLLKSGRLAKAFSLGDETAETRDRYGRHAFGQSLLMARRVLEVGIPLVQVNVGVAGQWDTHVTNCPTLKKYLLPPFDLGIAALLDDLQSSGLLDETLVIITGEFGRTPKLGGNVGTPSYSPDGRDHWTECFSSMFAGAGVHSGQVIGSSDKIAAFPATKAWRMSDLGATIYQALGVPAGLEIRDSLGRLQPLNSGEPISPLFTGA